MMKARMGRRGWRTVRACLGAVMALSLHGSPARAEEAERTVEGVAAVHKGGPDIARDAAIEDALRKAVEQVVGTLIASETMVSNFQVLSDSIYSKAKGYITEYKVIDEREKEGLYRVKIRAKVGSEDVKDDLKALGLLYKRMKKPRIMVVIPETHINASPPDPAGETEIIKQFVKNGFKVVDQAQIRRIRESDRVRKAIGGDMEAAKLLALQHDAEVLVVGEAFSEGAGRQPELANMISCRARLEARAIRADTGEILAADGAFGAGLDITEFVAGKKALSQAGSSWVESALPMILDRWTAESSGENSIQLVINGLSFSQLVKFKEILKSQVRGVKDFNQRSFTATTATIDVDGSGTAQAMADELALKDFGGFKVEVTEFSPNRLELKVLSR